MKHRKVFIKKNKKEINNKYTKISKKNIKKSKKITKTSDKTINEKHIPVSKTHRKVYKKTDSDYSTPKHNTQCAPFIQPKNLSSSKFLKQSNINIVESATSESCFSNDALRKIASKWNESNPQNLISYNENTDGKILWIEINKMMSNKCKTETCWMKQDFIKDSPLARELLKNFKPFMPKTWVTNPIEWLNTIDIRDVMNQYEIKHSDFEFIGPVPMDFDTKIGFGQCVVDELCKVKLDKLIAKGDSKLGVIFNLDKHTQSGSHWVAMYCDVNKNGGFIGYWDSYGLEPNTEVVVLMDRLKAQAKEIGYNLEIKINKNRHQYKNSECGVYCIYFITSLLDGKNFEEVVNNIISDDLMNANRKNFYNENNE